MKRFLSLLSFVVVSIVAFAQTYSITPQQFSLEVGGDGQQLVLLKDGNKYEGTVKWIAGSEESEKLIAVSDDGLVTAYAAGSAMVNAVVDDAIVATAYATISDKKPTSKYGFYTGENLMLVVGDRQWQCLFVYDEKGESTMYEGVVEWSIENEKTEVITLQDAETSNAIYMSADAIGSAKLSAKVDGEVVAELIVGVRDSYKLLPETYTLEASRDTITYYVFNSQGDTVKPYSYELQCRWLDNQPHIEHCWSNDGYGIMVWGTGYGNSEGSLYVSVEDRGNVYENVIYQLISSEYTGEIYAAEDVSLFLGGGSQKLVILDALGAEVTLPEGFYIDYDSSFVSIKNGQITPLKYGQQSLRIVGKSGVMSSFNVTITNEAGYVIDVWAGEKITEGDEIYIDLQKKEEGFEYLQSVENPTFVSSADSIVKCEGNMLLAVAPGDATITAVVDKEPVAEISITVVAKETMTYKVSPSEKFELMVDDTQEFTLYAGDLKYEGDVEWIVTAVSDNPVETGKELAKFDGNILYAYEPGIVQVFAVIPAYEGDKQTIQGPQVEILKAKDYRFAFEQEQYTMMAGEQATASLIFGDDIDLSLATVEVFPSNDSLSASIGQNQNIVVLYSDYAGEYTVTALCRYGDQKFETDVTVIVNKKVEYFLQDSLFSLAVGDSKELILYKNDVPYEGDIEWNVFEEEPGSTPCAEISNDTLYALQAGTCTIEAKVDGNIVAKASVVVTSFSGKFFVSDTVFCDGSEGTIFIACSESYNTEFLSIQSADGRLIDFEIDKDTVYVDYANLDNGLYIISYAGMQVATFEVVVNELPEIEIVPTVDSYVVGTEYQFGVQLFGDSESTESVVYRWEVIDESNPDSRDNMDYKHENSSLLVTFFAEGDYTINCEPLDKELGCQGKMVSTQVTVGKKVTYQIGEGKYLLNVGETKQLILYANGEEYTGDDVEWNILGDGTTEEVIAEVSDGVLSALAEGTCTIEAKLGGNVVATAALTIIQPVTYHFETDNFNMMVGETKELILYKNGEVYEGIVEWKVLDADGMVLAEVDEYGYLHANYEGSTTIYAIIDTVVAQASLTIEYTGGNSKSIGFTEPGYSVTEGGTTGMCLELYGFDSGFTIDYELSSEDIASCEFYYESNCFKLEGLSVGRTMLYVTLLDGEDKYTASAAISVNEKPIVHFDEEEYFMSIGDEVTASLVFEKDIMLPEDDKMQVEFENENLFEILKMDKYSVTFKALQTGVSSISASIYDGNYTATSSIFVGEKIIIPEDTLPAPTCDYENNTYTVCTSYAAEFPNGIPMDRMVYSEMEMENEDIVYQWYNAAGEPLEKTPVIHPTQIGSFTYYVSQKMKTGVNTVNGVIYYESEKIPVTLKVTYVPTPTINMYDQKICNGEEIKPFKVNIPDKTEAYWYDENWNEVATGAEFVPTNIALGKRVYTVIVRDTNWCESKELQVSLVNGFVEKPAVTLLSDKNEFAPNEVISFVAKPSGDNIGIIWSANNENTTGNEFKTKFGEIGEYAIICKAVDQESGCSASDTQKVVVKEAIIPVEAIEILQKDYDLYVGESALIEYHIIPEHATNKNVNVRCTSTGSTDAAVVRGMRINAVADGTEMIVISSDANPEVTAECFVRVHKKVKGENIVMPSLITLEVGSETSVNVVVTPSDATYNTVYFKEKEDDIISISSDGIIRAKSAGTSTISAYTADGLYATATVYVTEETKTITTINVPSEVVLKKGESMAISYSIEPVSLAIKEIAWAMADEGIASFEDGIIKANNVGETTLTASVAGISKSIKITVNNSNAPVLNLPTVVDAPVSVTNDKELKSISLGQAIFDLSEFVSDDSTAFENLEITVTTNPANLEVSNSGAIYVIDGKGMEGLATINLSVTDVDGLTTTGSFGLNFITIVNEAPEILVDTLVVKYGTPSYFDFAALAQDDFTSTSLLEFTFGSAEGIETKIVDKRLVVTADYGSKEFNNIDMRVVDAYGTAASKTIVVKVASLPNKAPVIAVVPNQVENDTIPFGTFNLNDYVIDDYTAPSDIVWTVTSSENIAVRISNGVAVVKVLNEFWNGAEVITFTATDEEGLSTSVDVYYIRNISQVTYEQQKIETNAVAPVWEGAPTVSIMTMRQIGVPNQEFVLMANISSFDCTWEWIIDGAEGIDQTSMLQSVTFKNPGLYTVKMKVMSADGQHVVEAELPVQLTVVGIENHDIAICQGDAVELNAIGDVNSLLWSTDEISSSIFVRPSTTTKYTLTMKKGMFTMVDEVIVNVSVPVSLMEDSVMCAGTEFALEAQGEFESYSWNTGATSKSITIPAELASYIVYATDANNCMSVDTFNITKVNELPILDIAKDAELNPCDGTEVTLNAGVGYAEYAWTITKGAKTENQTAVETITVDTTTIVAATVVDENGCIGQQEVTVNFKYPYAEQLGVATFSETTDHIILAWEKTMDVNTVKYRIERETHETDNWEQVGEDVMFDEPGLIVDEDVNYKQRAYKYRLVTTDVCNNEAISEVHRSMIATYQNQDNGLKTIQWCAYEPMSMITQYLVLRGTDVTAMDTVDKVPASNLYEIWNEVDPQFKNVKDIKYRVVFRLKEEVDENKYNTLASVGSGKGTKEYDEQMLKAESGPFALALSNIAEAENTTDIDVVPFADVVVYPTAITSVINVAIASNEEKDFEIEVVNTNGQSMSKVHTGAISKAIIQIPAEGFAQGLYNVKISDGMQTKSFKVTK